MPQAYVGGNAKIGFGTVINIHACVPHDSKIGKIVNLSPHATLGGGVSVGDYSQIGMQVSINLGVKNR